ncbi:phage tail assembly chaperone [Pseudomonas mosselii]
MKALIQEGVVVGFVSGDAFGECLPDALPVNVGWRFENGEFLAPAELTAADLISRERAWRDIELTRVVWLRDRHRDQLEAGMDTEFTQPQFTELLHYLQALRDWPQSAVFPDISARPVQPAFLLSARVEQ